MGIHTPTVEYEQSYWQQGISLIAGIDEVGVGALAGPVCAAAVIMPSQTLELPKGIKIRDSKSLSEAQRDKANAWIKEQAVTWAVGEASVEEIASLNVLQAARLAMRRAVDALSVMPEMMFVDGNPVQLHKDVPTINIIKGDKLCYSVAAASILAKVHRDTYMKELHEQFPMYGFAGHKGYGSSEHMKQLQEFGPSVHHRSSYAPIAELLQKQKS